MIPRDEKMKFSLKSKGVHMKKTIIAISFLTFSCVTQAGFNGLTMHSRANCGNNESISWDALKPHHLGTNSTHAQHGKQYHALGSGIATTQRSAAVCWGEGTGGWTVYGEHYVLEPKTNKIIDYRLTTAVDCSAYDGWWDWNP
jgi:hypothetical protein